ncbi:phosphatidylinositol-specific phospholipase C [Streptomyces syringium]|uniref:1-phosphatidylinositol phosphodiesterase n=1 Tax=Streptomyces syringium TaxID=76729 RepID=A0ABS4XWC6_9ACTN|nr:phosphatidylinositol-specific phospholipase C [Streptomyces syringium]MBP2400814.1 hypothetical protein [Streptomyces syringium]
MSVATDLEPGAVTPPAAPYIPGPWQSGDTGGVRTDNWMSQLPDSISMKRVTIPGTHESGARYAGASAGFAQCQNVDFTIATQLAAGIRYLDVRCRNYNGSLLIHHDAFYQYASFENVVQQCEDFLKARPTEALFMRLKRDYHNNDAGDDGTDEGFVARFEEVRKRHDIFCTEGIPILGQARGKIILLGNVSGLPGTDWGSSQLDIQDYYDLSSWTPVDNKLAKVTAQLDKARRDNSGTTLYVNHISGYSVSPPRTPWSISSSANPRALKAIQDRFTPSGRGCLGIVPMDYADADAAPGLVQQLIRWNDLGGSGHTRTLTLERAELLSFNDGGVSPAIHGTICVDGSCGSSTAWHRSNDSGSPVIFERSRGTFALAETVTNSSADFKITVELRGHDAQGLDAIAANGVTTWTPADGAGRFHHIFTGEKEGQVQLTYTVS